MWEKRDRDRIAAVKALFALEKQMKENKMCKIAVIYCIIWIYKQKKTPKNCKT